MISKEKLQLIDQLYKKPFKYDRESQMVFDAKNAHVADIDQDGVSIRGWGRIQKLENPELIQDAFGELVTHLLNTGYGYDKFTTDEEIAIRLDERKRAIEICRQSQKEYEQDIENIKSLDKSKAADIRMIHLKAAAEEARQLGNAISGHNALTVALKVSDEDIIRENTNANFNTDEEILKCIHEPWHFFNTYVRINGQKPQKEMTQHDWNMMLEFGKKRRIL